MDKLPFAVRLHHDGGFTRNDDPVDADPRQLSIWSTFVLRKIIGRPWRDLTVNRAVEFAANTSRDDWAVAIDQPHSAPHRRAPRPHNGADRSGFVFRAICLLR